MKYLIILLLTLSTSNAFSANDVDSYDVAGFCAGSVLQAVKSGLPLKEVPVETMKTFIKVTNGEYKSILEEVDPILGSCGNTINSKNANASIEVRNAAFDACIVSKLKDTRKIAYVRGLLRGRARIMTFNKPTEYRSVDLPIMCYLEK
jgi:hypothetical protein